MTPDIEKLFTQAQVQKESGNYREAIYLYQRILAKAKSNPLACELAYARLGDIYLTVRDLQTAEKHLKWAIRFNDQEPYYHYLLGFTYSVGTHWDKAISELRLVVAQAPDNGEYLRALGWALFQHGEIEEGKNVLIQALRLDPTNAYTLTDLAMLHTSQHEYDQSLIYARRATELAPNVPLVKDALDTVKFFKAEFERLAKKEAGKAKPKGGRTFSKKEPKPRTEEEWRAFISTASSPLEVVNLWFKLNPPSNVEEAQTETHRIMELWNTTPRPELGGLSPNEIAKRKD